MDGTHEVDGYQRTRDLSTHPPIYRSPIPSPPHYAYLGLGLTDVLAPKEKLPVQIGQINRVQVHLRRRPRG